MRHACRQLRGCGSRRLLLSLLADLALLVVVVVSLLAGSSSAQQVDAPLLSALGEVPEQSGVLLLSSDDFASAVRAFQPLFVLVDSPARKGSLELFRAFADAAVVLRASQREVAPRLRLAAMDAAEASALPSELNAIGLPAFLRFRCSPKVASAMDSSSSVDAASFTECSLDDADVDAYTGGRTSAEFQRFMLEEPQKEVSILYDRAALEALVRSHPFVVLVVVDGRDSQPYFDAISLAQTDAQAISVYAVSANRLLLESDDERARVPSVVVFRDFGAARVDYAGPWKKSAIVSFLRLNKYSLVSTYTSQFSGFLFDRRAAAHVLLFSDASESYHETLMAQTEALAQQYASGLGGAVTLRFVFVPMNESALRGAMFVTRRHVPIVLIVHDVGEPPLRFPLFGAELVAALDTSAYADTLGELLANTFPPVFTTADGEDDEVVVDDGPGFESSVATASASDSASATTAVPSREDQQPKHARMLQEVAVTTPLSPWEIQRQQTPRLAHDVANALWVRKQQQLGHVVVCFVSPRCYACREFADVFEQVARLATDGATPAADSRVVFARINVDDVDIAPLQVDISRLPSIFVFPRGAQAAAAIPYTARSFMTADVLAFVRESCKSAHTP